MTFDPAIHHRQSTRLKGYDYSQPGAYFVTICVQGHECLLGHVSDGKMIMNDTGETVREEWENLPSRFPEIVLDAFVIMPNHFHGIIVTAGAGLSPPKEGAASSAPTLVRPIPTMLWDVVRVFKSMSAIRVNRILSRSGQLWQRNYYDHVIRSEDELDHIRRYILDNPMKWSEDSENPSAGV